MGTGVIVAVLVLAGVAAVGAVAVSRSRRTFKQIAEGLTVSHEQDHVAQRAAMRLTSAALRDLPSPPWRIVHEIGPDRLTGAEHVAIGPAGAFALTTSLDELPSNEPASDAAASPDPAELARVAMTRGGLDDALRRVGMRSAGLVVVHWSTNAEGPGWVAGAHGATHVDGRRLADWAHPSTHAEAGLTQSQIDLAWQAVVTAIGRPDPLA